MRKGRTMVEFGLVLGLILVVFVAVGGFFTSNFGARMFGGTQTITLPKGKQFENVTWKDTHLWVLTRDGKEGDTIEPHTFHEYSAFGVLQGTVVIREQ